MGQQGITSNPTSEAAPHRRVLLFARPCLIVAHLRDQLDAKGFATTLGSPDRPVSSLAHYDACVTFLTRCDASNLVQAKQRLDELRDCNPGLLAVAMIEDSQLGCEVVDFTGFATVLIGLPSLTFVIDVVHHLVLHRPREIFEIAPQRDAAITFTPREYDLIDCLRRGLPNKLIAHELGVTMSTTKSHLRNIMQKLGATNRTEVACRLNGVQGQALLAACEPSTLPRRNPDHAPTVWKPGTVVRAE